MLDKIMAGRDEVHIAIDLGAGSGRVICGRFGQDRFEHKIIHRFDNRVYQSKGHERWDTKLLFAEIKRGLGLAGSEGYPVKSIGVDSWGVDYGLFDHDGKLIDEPVYYRDNRIRGQLEKIFQRITREQIYRATGIQFMDLNTISHLYAQVHGNEWPAEAETFLMMPDILNYYLTGIMKGEYTNATTTQLLNVHSKTWDESIFAALELPLEIMPEILDAGTGIGPLKKSLQDELNLPGASVVLPATHDTGSAIIGTPLEAGWAYLSSGTWSILGIECSRPVLNDRALALNCSNEGGAYNTIGFLKNVIGLWILESCRKEWAAQSVNWDYEQMQAAIGSSPPCQSFIGPDDPRFLHPESMLRQIDEFLEQTGQNPAPDIVGTARLILDSLALKYASVIEAIQEASGVELRGIHVVGGGSQNHYLNQATANATALPVTAGPVEATSVGNLLVQAITAGRFSNVSEARVYIRRNATITDYSPADQDYWKSAREKFSSLAGAP